MQRKMSTVFSVIKIKEQNECQKFGRSISTNYYDGLYIIVKKSKCDLGIACFNGTPCSVDGTYFEFNLFQKKAHL